MLSIYVSRGKRCLLCLREGDGVDALRTRVSGQALPLCSWVTLGKAANPILHLFSHLQKKEEEICVAGLRGIQLDDVNESECASV